MKTAIHYTHKLADGFYHATVPVLYLIDTLGRLEDCPFPIKTDSFEVLAWGETNNPYEAEPKHGHTHRFAVVRFTKGCGHTVEERISFSEGVETFTHYGTTFTGESYSVKDWQRRIEFFRSYPCDVCGLVKHCVWIWASGLGVNSRQRAIDRCVMLLNANFGNWRDFISPETVIERFAAKRGSQR